MQRLMALAAAAALLGTSIAAAQDTTVTLVTHDSFAVSETVLEQFTEETGYSVEIIRSGDAGLLVNQAILTRNDPLGDVLFGVDNTFLGRALEADLFEPYASPELDRVDPVFREGLADGVTPIDFGDVCLNYDVAWFSENAMDIPETLAELADPQYQSLLAVQNPATSSPGLAFLAATVAIFGDSDDTDGESYLDFWRALVDNDVSVSENWTNAYYGEFSGSAGSEGTRPLVVSYASSPAAEVYFAEATIEAAPTGAIIDPETCFRQIEYAGILSGTDQPDGARALIDFMLSMEFQSDMPLNMFVYPVVTDAHLPEVFEAFAAVAEEPVTLDADIIDANRDRWIEEWTEVVLR
jgi:thiamine transport system substrate-binding protein